VSAGTLVRNYGATNMAPDPLVEEETPFLFLGTSKNRSWRGPETKNDCADEGQQEFTGPGPGK
jgi:hypothetical protein